MVKQVKVASSQAIFHVLMTSTIAVGTALALLIGVHHVNSGWITLGELLLIMAYMAQLYEPLRTISSKLPELQAWIISMRRALALLYGVPEIMEIQNTQPVGQIVRMPAARKSLKLQRLPGPTTSSWPCLRGTTQRSAKGAVGSPEDNASASRSPVPS
jgi:ABC-type multidrug transport system fused ATPase/permease subunit